MNKSTIMYVGVGVVIGLVFANQLRKLPVVKSIPTV